MKWTITSLVIAAIAVWIAAPTAAQENPYAMPDESWISISGTAVDPGPASFTLDYGEATVEVEMDDWDWYGDAYGIMDGDEVTVYGRVDDDMFDTTAIEASSVYVQDLGTYYYASAADEEDDYAVYDYWVVGDVSIGDMTMRGTVTSIDGREFTIDTGPRQLTVDTIMMDYNPLDDLGYPDVDVGDYVSVTGEMDYDTWTGRELTADTVAVLVAD